MSEPSETSPHILVVDDDRRIRSLLQKFLSDQGYRASIAANSAEARKKLSLEIFDLIVLDVMMPGETGLELTSVLRKEANYVPILMLTALADVDNRIEGLRIGADDYLPKPFEPTELLLRIRNILRRQEAMPDVIEMPDEISFGDCVFKPERGELLKNGERIPLTTREIELMRCFASKGGRIVRREELTGDEENISERAIDVQINRLRRKIEDTPRDPIFLQTVRGAGYILQTD